MRSSPYKGLAPFDDSEHDVQFFFGREREREVICANLMASRLTVLYGESGVGKSSVLRAGVAYELRASEESVAVVVFDDWRDDPVTALKAAVARTAEIEPMGSLADTLELCTTRIGGDLYVILDGVEEYFLYHGDEQGPGSFLEEFPEAIRRPGLRVGFLLALREDALARLDRFKASIPNLFGNYLRLEHLDRTAAREAIVRPVEQYNRTVAESEQVTIEAGLVDAVLDEVAAGRVDLGQAGRGVVKERAGDARVETPYLQLVMQRLWEAERDAGSRTLRRSTLIELGGAEQIVRDHLERALDSLTPDQGDLASLVFNHLVTPSGTKIAHAEPDLARYAGVEEAELQPVLATLTHERILRPVAPDGGVPRYEIYHDVLGEAVLAWRSGHEAARELEQAHRAADQRQRRLMGVIGVGAVLLAVMAGVTVFAVSQRSEARSHARQAQARQLDASAVSLLTTDPSLSLSLAAEAARISPTQQADETLRTAYIASRQRAILAAGAPVSASSYSPDGKLILVASRDGRARLYDAASRRLVRSFDHGAPILDAAFGPDSRYLVTAGQDGNARVWTVARGTQARTLRHGAPIRAVAFDPSGMHLVTAGGRAAKLWRMGGGLIASLPWKKPVTGASFGPGGRLVMVIGNDSVARLYDARTGRLVRGLDQGGPVTSAAFGPGGGLLVTTGANETARIWRVRDGRLLRELKGHRGSVLAAAFSPRGSRIATASADGTGRIWNVHTGALLASILGHKGIVDAVAFSPDGNFVVTGSTDRTARVSKVDNGDGRALLAGHADSVHTVAFSRDGKFVLTASNDSTARLWDPRTQPQLGVVARAGGPVSEAEYVGPGETIAVAGPGNRVRLVRASDGRTFRTFAVSRPVRAVGASADGGLVAVVAGPRVTIFRASDGARAFELAHPAATAVVFAPDGSRLVTAGSGGVARIWSADGRLLRTLEGHSAGITDVAFSPDGARVATSSGDKTARIWDAETGALLRRLAGHRDDVTSVVFSPDGRLVLTASRDHDARLWDAESGAVMQVLRWHFGEVADASFSPDGRWILTAGPATVGLWQPGVREPILPYGFGGHKPPLTSAVFDPSSRFVLTASADGTVRRAECVVCRDLDGMLALARVQLAGSGRTLTTEERERYGLD